MNDGANGQEPLLKNIYFYQEVRMMLNFELVGNKVKEMRGQ